VDQDVGVSQLGNHFLGIGDKVGRDIAAVELHSLNDSSSVGMPLASSTVITPSLPPRSSVRFLSGLPSLFHC
jgi:hypothetical protein